MLKNLELSNHLGYKFLKAIFGVISTGHVTFFWLVDGEATAWWCPRNLVLSLKFPFFIWGGTFVPDKDLKNMHIPWGYVQDLLYHCTIVSWLLFFCFCIPSLLFSSVQSLSCVQLFATPWSAAHQASLSITNSLSSPKPMSTELVMPSNHLILCCPLLLLHSIFPSIRVFPLSQLFTSGGQSFGVSTSTSVLPVNTQDWSPLGWTGWISLQSKGLSRVFSNTTVQKHQFWGAQFLYSPTFTSIHDQWKSHSLD